jgi:hypothetical protein
LAQSASRQAWGELAWRRAAWQVLRAGSPCSRGKASKPGASSNWLDVQALCALCSIHGAGWRLL